MKKIIAALFLLLITSAPARAETLNFSLGDTNVEFNMPAGYAAGEDDNYNRLVKAISQTAAAANFSILGLYVKNTGIQPDYTRYILIGVTTSLEKTPYTQREFDVLKQTILKNQGKLASAEDIKNAFKDISGQLNVGLSVDSKESLGGFDIRENSFSTLDIVTQTTTYQGKSATMKQAQINTYIFRGNRAFMLLQYAPVASAEEIETFKADATKTFDEMNFTARVPTLLDRYKKFGIPVFFVAVYLVLRNMNKKRRAQMQAQNDKSSNLKNRTK